MYANIIVDISSEKLDRTFQYSVPEHLLPQLHPGMVVTVPFGRSGRLISGYVIELTEESEYDPDKIKSIVEIKSSEDTVESRLIALAAWMREQYGSTMLQALKTVLPVKEKVLSKNASSLVFSGKKEEAEELLALWKRRKYTAQVRVLEQLMQENRLDCTQASKQLGMTARIRETLISKGMAREEREEIFRNPLSMMQKRSGEKQTLSVEQAEVFQGILSEWYEGQKRACLLKGVTGSGKTLVYMELMEEVLKKGKQVILLIPEIALTWQTVQRFYQRFGDKISVINSRLSMGERYDQFRRAKNGQVQIMIGPRSALFTPFPNLGLIIIDEEHENSYKSEHSPRYHARETAIHRAEMEDARVLLGSATPSVESYYRAKNGEYALFQLEHRFETRPLPEVSVIDMREELKNGNRSILSRKLAAGLEERLKKGEQSILFLNRRGYAGFISCRSCGYVAKCPHCDVSLTEHFGDRMVCHYCGYETVKVKKCPSCSSPYIGGFKAGTQQIEDVLLKYFPDARVLRMDYDTTRKKGEYEEILQSFSEGKADILIGTQMVVKGHDFPRVTLSGVLAADLSLNTGDYRSAERTFQLLCQSVGRSGRGNVPGEAIIQTYHPEHYSIATAAEQDYEEFFQEEMSFRRIMHYPPSGAMLSVLGQGEDQKLLEQAMQYLKKFIQKIYPHKQLKLIGPADQAVGKVNDIYRMELHMKHTDKRVLIAIKDKTEQYMNANSGFQKLLIQFDFEN